MRICAEHWQIMRDAIEKYGMNKLVSPNGETAHANMVDELQGEPDPAHQRFDPLMSMHWHWTNSALRQGGLYLLGGKEDGSSYCPVCEFSNHYKDFDPVSEVNKVAEQMSDWCRSEKLIEAKQ